MSVTSEPEKSRQVLLELKETPFEKANILQDTIIENGKGLGKKILSVSFE